MSDTQKSAIESYGEMSGLLPKGATVFYFISDNMDTNLFFGPRRIFKGVIEGFTVGESGHVESHLIRPTEMIWSHGSYLPMSGTVPVTVDRWHVAESIDGLVSILQEAIEAVKKFGQP